MSVQCASGQYGSTSKEAKAVTKAWKAVGF